MKNIQEQLHDEFCVLIVFLACLAIGMMVGVFYHASKGYGSAVRQGLDSYNQIVLK